MRKLILRIIVGSLVVTALLGVIVILTGSFGELTGKVLLTTVLVDVASIVGLCCAGQPSSVGHRYIQKLGLGASVLFLAVALIITWVELPENLGEFIWRILAVAAILAVSSAHASLILPSALHSPRLRKLVFATVICIAIVAELLLNTVVIPGFYGGDTYFKIVAVVLILDVLGTILIPLTRRFSPPAVSPPPYSL